MNLKISQKIDKLKELPIEELCKKFNCLPEEICMGDYQARYTEDTVCPYKVIMGFANFECSNVKSLGNLEVVLGKKLEDRANALTDINGNPTYLGVNFANSDVCSLGNLKKVYGSITLNEKIQSLGQLQYLGSNLFLGNSKLQDLGDLEIIDGMLNFERTTIKSLGKLKKVERLRIASPSLVDFGDLETVKEITISSIARVRLESLIEKNFIYDNGKYKRIKENIIEQ